MKLSSDGGSTPEHDYVIGSRSRDPHFSTANLVHFISKRANALLFPNERSSPVPPQRVYTSLTHPRALQVSLTIKSALLGPTLNTPPDDVPQTCLQRGRIGPLTPPLWVPRSPLIGHMSWLYSDVHVLSPLLSTLDVAL